MKPRIKWERTLNWICDGQELNDKYNATKEEAIKNLDDLLRRYYKNKPGQGIKTDLQENRG
jgi:hypothetical protein